MDHHRTPKAPRLRSTAFIVLRTTDGVLTTDDVRRARWSTLTPGQPVTVAAYDLRSIGAGAAELLARFLVDGRTHEVEFQVSGHLRAELEDRVNRAGLSYCTALMAANL